MTRLSTCQGIVTSIIYPSTLTYDSCNRCRFCSERDQFPFVWFEDGLDFPCPCFLMADQAISTSTCCLGSRMTRIWRRLGPLCDCLQNQTSLLSQSEITTIVYEPLPAHGHYGKYKSILIPSGLPHFGLFARWYSIYVPLNSVQGGGRPNPNPISTFWN